MTLKRILINSTVASARRALKSDTSGSPSLRAVVEVLITIIELLQERLGVPSSRTGPVPPSQDPHHGSSSKKGKTAQRKSGR